MEGSRRSVARISAEFLLIVLGVLVALAVDRWSESRADRELEVMYLERLRVDMIGSRSDLQIPYYEGVEAHSRAALPYVAREQELSDSVGLVIAAYHAHRMLTPRVRDATHRELLATGNLRVIKDLELREALAELYSEVAFWKLVFDPSVQDSDFNHYVRGRIPPDLQFEIADRCPIDEQQPFGCTTDLGDWDPSDFINGLRSEPIAVEGLTRRLRDVVRMNGVLNNIDEMIEDILRRIE